MFSDVVKSAIEREVVGQPRAVNSVVRGVTAVMSGLTPRERTLCAYLFMGPTGTGKTHLVQALARVVHGDDSRVVVADCAQFVHGDPWAALVAQLAPLFSVPRSAVGGTVLETPPLSIIRVENVERGAREIATALAALLETGQVLLPGGRRGSLRNCLVFLSSGLCAKEILDEAPRIGFSGAIEDDNEHDRIFGLCSTRAEEKLGADLVGRLDGLVIFYRLQPEHLEEIVDRRLDRLNQWLTPRGFRIELRPEAREFLLERGTRNPGIGARDLARAQRRFVEFPVADLMVSGRIPPGGLVRVGRLPGEEHLHFTIEQAAAGHGTGVPEVEFREVPIAR